MATEAEQTWWAVKCRDGLPMLIRDVSGDYVPRLFSGEAKARLASDHREGEMPVRVCLVEFGGTQEPDDGEESG